MILAMLESRALPAYAALFIHYKNPGALVESILGLLRQTHRPTEVYVVDNSAHVSPLTLPEEFDGKVTVISASHNGGYAFAVNLVREYIALSAVSHLLVATQDVLWQDDTLAELAAAALSSDSAACVGPVLNYRSEHSKLFSQGGVMGFGGRNVHLRSSSSVEQSLEVEWIDGAVMFLAIDSLNSVGWLDEDYFLYYEEVDLCHRLRIKLGQKILLAPRAIAYQEPGNYTPYLRLRNQILFWKKNYGGWQIFPAIAYQFLRTSARATLIRRPRNIGWATRGIIDGCRGAGGKPPAFIRDGFFAST